MIEGDSTDLQPYNNRCSHIYLPATSDVVVPANVGITFGSGEKIEGDITEQMLTYRS